ncbi:hypothetical protein AB0O82_10840 [Kitasatospora sp. NPDC088264]|uniref:hypothetical protein n=1 Tax=Kitasatospora sp. NPDC088264 TaxID=3155296 RepID=UPI003431055C
MTAPAHQPGAEPSVPPQPPTADPGSSLITQDTLSRLLAREKSQGERSAVRKLTEGLGFTDAASLTAWVEAQRTAQQAALSEVERREQAAEQRERAAEQREEAAFARLRSAVRQTALARLGAVGDNLSDAERLLDVADDADEQAVADAVEALKTRRPELFGPAAPAPAAAPPAPSGSPAGGPPQRGQAPSGVNAGLEMAKRRGYIQPPA